MQRAYKYRLYPSVTQEETLNRTLTLCRRLYNAGLEQRIAAHRSGAGVNYSDQAVELPPLKRELAEYNGVHAQALQDVLRRLDKAFRNFFRRVAEKKKGAKIKAGFPRFKSARRFQSFTYPQSGFAVLPNGHICISKIGEVRMFQHRPVDGAVKTCTIKRDAVGDWYAILGVELPDVPAKEPRTAIGVDVGLEHFVTLSTGETIEPPKFLSQSLEKIKRTQRKVSRKVKGSKNRNKARKRLARAHRRVERQRNDFLHKVSRTLVQKADVVVFENLRIPNMVQNHRLARSIMDASWGRLIEMTRYKAESAGGRVVLVDPQGTSQICSRCGETVLKSMSVRVHTCPKCGFSADRDFNAALNILRRLHPDRVELCKTPVETLPPQLPSGGCE